MVNRRNLSAFIAIFFLLWTGAWLLHQGLVFGLHWWTSDAATANLWYWIVLKFVVWVLYPWLFWRHRLPVTPDRACPGPGPGNPVSLGKKAEMPDQVGHDNGDHDRRAVASFIGLSPTTLKRGYKWGIITTLIWLVFSLAAMPLMGQHFHYVTDWAMWVYVATLTPIFEEIMFRGFIVASLLALKYDGKVVNVITTVLFVLIHFVGWAFQGVFLHNIASTTWVSIALISLIAGFIRIHSGSLRASILLHMSNNMLAGLMG